MFGLPGGVSKQISEEERVQMETMAKSCVEFGKFTVQLFKDVVLGNKDYMNIVLNKDAYYLESYYMGMVDDNNKVQFYDGPLRVVDPSRKEYAKFPVEEYRDYVAEHLEPWSYIKFCYLKPLGWHGFEEGPQSSIYAVAPLARLNAAEGMRTPLAQKAAEEYFATLGGKPVHHTLATHWARVVEMIQAAEDMVELLNDPEITSKDIASVRSSCRDRFFPPEAYATVAAISCSYCNF